MPELPEKAAAAGDDATLSPAALALRRFWRQGWAKLAVLGLALFAVVAIYAPVLASEVALVWWDADGVRFPLLADLFNRNSYRARHDLLFNLLLVLLPLQMLVL